MSDETNKCLFCTFGTSEPGKKHCRRCDVWCEYCNKNRSNDSFDGCGNRICYDCDKIYPKTRCLNCLAWHRTSYGLCEKCKGVVSLPPELSRCYGTCTNGLYGFEAVCSCRYSKIKTEEAPPEEP